MTWNDPMNRQRLPRALASIALVSGLLALSACQSTRRGTANTYTFTEGHHAMVADVNDSRFADRIQVLGPRTVRATPGERIVAQFELHNARSNRIRIEYDIDWFDQNGVEVEFPGGWTPLSLSGGSNHSVRLTAPTTAVTSWKLQVRPPSDKI